MGFFSWMMNPAMLGLGALAVSVPIIIHLLNKRRFKVVAWAAMEFLLDADKQNRRRVQLQHWLLLMLRCLAMLLLGLLLARPLLPSALSQLMQEKQQFERVVVLDDSLSQQVVIDSLPAFDQAKATLAKMVTDLADAEDSDNWLTLYVTSNADQPILVNEPVTTATLPTLIETIEGLVCSDRSADYATTLEQVDRYVAGQRENFGRVVYIFSDLRRRDWTPLTTASNNATNNAIDTDDSSPQKLLAKMAENVSQGFIVDCANDNDQNLAVIDLRSEDLLVSNRLVRFTATVVNHGTETVSNIRLLLQIDEQAPVYETVPSLAPGQEELVTFRYLFPSQATASERIDGLASADSPTPRHDHRVKVEIDRQGLGQSQLQSDQLPQDNVRNLAARVMDSIPVLLVDGDPSSISERSETHYLKFLDVFGTGLKTDIVSANELETLSLANYRAIFLCNVDQISADRVKTLEQWVRDGGAMVFLPGNQVRAATFNETFYRDGQGISPLELLTISGDPTMSSWVNFEVNPQTHPSLRTLVESDAGGLLRVDIFSWWTSQTATSAENPVSVPLRLNDEANSPAMVERAWGRGKVIAFSIPADGDWSMWPAVTGVFVPMMLDLIDYLAGTDDNRATLALGQSIEYPVDLSAFNNQVGLRDSQNERIEAIARPVDDSEAAKNSTLYRVEFPPVERSGFYELGLTRLGGEVETTLFAANSPAEESQLKRLDLNQIPDDFWGNKFQLVGVSALSEQVVTGASAEFWPQIVWLILLVLIVEQFLGWWFGRNQ
jgi:hypothetical protein